MDRTQPPPAPRQIAPRAPAPPRPDASRGGGAPLPAGPSTGPPVKPLPTGGTIGVAAPASPYDSRSEVLRGVEWWASQGYKVKLAPNVYARDDYVAGDAETRAGDLNALFA